MDHRWRRTVERRVQGMEQGWEEPRRKEGSGDGAEVGKTQWEGGTDDGAGVGRTGDRGKEQTCERERVQETEGRSKHLRKGTGDRGKEQTCEREVVQETEGRSKHVREKGYRRWRGEANM